MAANITTSAQFTTTNMKPASGEQLDALWGQNIADNTGYVYYRPVRSLDFSFSAIAPQNVTPIYTFKGTKWFRKEAGFNSIVGSYSMFGSQGGGAARSLQALLFYNGTQITLPTLSMGSVAGEYSSAGSIVIPTTHLTNGVDYQLSYRITFQGNSGAPLWTSFEACGWQVP